MSLKKINLGPKEKAVEAYFVRQVELLGGRAYKFVSPSQQGVPDRIVVFQNRAPIFVELKADGGRLSAIQRNEIQYLLDMGQSAYVCKGRRGVDEFLTNVLKEAGNE